ncbi:hypothetical protein FO440_18410 [Mucilaginibacter corticis]|uniref:Uncharacterized protein n=1 Tax=Mucilaginibacter corticis TaxID=2597670 RepID=A0A556MIH0_9SPHI|nr:hypothetical protein [Mucilaginibacter corticis]TSJ39711.1 hypothetical protein FO440_18410 [Mucilaginibacter corticis]
MWTKIRSDRDPKDTVFSEIRKEFKPYFDKVKTTTFTLLRRFPKSVFACMVILIVVSIVLAFNNFIHQVAPSKPVGITAPFQDGFDKILEAGTRLKETIRLKKVVDSISAKKQLNTTDSIRLIRTLDSLRHIYPSFK